jgi:uncharacterized alpha-E superfamily protein
MLLSRVAEHLYWGSRYMERADDTARVVRTFTEVILDLPTGVESSWEPLLAIAGSREAFDAGHVRAHESDVVRFLVADLNNYGSVVSSVGRARENLRTTREVLPREAWQVVNDLYLYTSRDAEIGVDRRSRSRFLTRVISEHQRFDGVLSGAMQRDEAYELWRLGQAIERADMTTRVLGVRAAALLSAPADVEDYDEVQWMGVLRSLSALQMYQRATRGPIDAGGVVAFLMFDERFPRSVAGCLRRIEVSLQRLPRPERTLPVVDAVLEGLGRMSTDASDGVALDAAMDLLQVGLARVNAAVHDTFVLGAE